MLTRICTLMTALLLAAASNTAAAPDLPRPIHASTVSCMDDIFAEKFARAGQAADRVSSRYPASPAGPFLRAAVLLARMEYDGVDSLAEPFDNACRTVAGRANELLRADPSHPWARFFMACAAGLQGRRHMMAGNMVQAVRCGSDGVDIMRALASEYPHWHDLQYGLGFFDYWSSRACGVLKHLPNADRKVQTALIRLRRASGLGVYFNSVAARDLLLALVEEGRYDEAVTLATNMHQRYPENRAVRLLYAQALIGAHQGEKAEEILLGLLGPTSGGIGNEMENASCHALLAQAYWHQGRFGDCAVACARLRRTDSARQPWGARRRDRDTALGLELRARRLNMAATNETQTLSFVSTN